MIENVSLLLVSLLTEAKERDTFSAIGHNYKAIFFSNLRVFTASGSIFLLRFTTQASLRAERDRGTKVKDE